MSTHTSFEDGRLTVTRVYDAPREAVFDAWIETSKVQQWWGCAQTTEVKSDIEARIGGKYFHAMTIDDSFEHQAKGLITEYDPPALLVYEIDDPEHGGASKIRVEFIEKGAKTEIRLTHDNIPDGLGEIVTGGWTAALGKLDVFLCDETSAA